MQEAILHKSLGLSRNEVSSEHDSAGWTVVEPVVEAVADIVAEAFVGTVVEAFVGIVADTQDFE
jgi:hypothetical protein